MCNLHTDKTESNSVNTLTISDPLHLDTSSTSNDFFTFKTEPSLHSDSEHSVDNDCSDLDHPVAEEQTMPPELMDELNLLADRQIEFAKRFNLIIPDKSNLSSDEDT